MSHFTSLKTRLSNQEALVWGLRNLFEAKNIKIDLEVYEQAVLLENAYDSRDRQMAHVVIRRKFLSTRNRESLIDIGFLRNSEGSFDLIADAWDFNQTVFCEGRGFSGLNEFKNQVQMLHDQARVELEYPPHLWQYEQATLADGSVQLTLTERPALVLSTSVSAW